MYIIQARPQGFFPKKMGRREKKSPGIGRSRDSKNTQKLIVGVIN